ncbi:MAG: hypothetical protein ABI680_10045 [Chthoniobacteraceae bacterium]
MKQKPLILLLTATVVFAVIAVSWRQRPELPHFRLSDGAEFRVFQIRYTPDPSNSWEHNLHAAPPIVFRLWLYLPSFLKSRVPFPDVGIEGYGSDHPAISIWWARTDPKTHEPELGPAGDVLVTFDSGQQVNLAWPSPADPGYRQIFFTDPPRDSKRLSFDVPVEDERMQFAIDNPAYHP